jgi:hypothetical protein
VETPSAQVLSISPAGTGPGSRSRTHTTTDQDGDGSGFEHVDASGTGGFQPSSPKVQVVDISRERSVADAARDAGRSVIDVAREAALGEMVMPTIAQVS